MSRPPAPEPTAPTSGSGEHSTTTVTADGPLPPWLVRAAPWAFGVAVLGWLIALFSAMDAVDLAVYHWGGERARTTELLYHGAYQGFLPFTYTPFAAVVFMPMSLLPWDLAKAMVTVINLLAVVFIARRSWAALGHGPSRTTTAVTWLIAAFALVLEPVAQTIGFGQVNLVLLAIVLADLTQPPTSRWRGVGIGVAAGFKLTPAIFIPYLLLTRQWATAVRAGAAFAVTVAVGFVILPAESAEFWLDRLFLDPARTGGVAYVANQSLNGVFLRLFGTVGARPWWIAAAVVIGGLTMLTAVVVTRRGHTLAGITLCGVVGLLISPVSWSHHWVWVVPALALGFDWWLRHGDTAARWMPRALGAAAALFLIVPWYPGLIWLAPHGGDQERAWTPLQFAVGNSYVLAVLTAVAATALVLSRQSRPIQP